MFFSVVGHNIISFRLSICRQWEHTRARRSHLTHLLHFLFRTQLTTRYTNIWLLTLFSQTAVGCLIIFTLYAAHSGAMQDSRTHATGFIVCVYIHEESSASELQETLSKVLLFHSFTFRDLLGDSYDRHNALLIQSRKTTHRRCGHWIWRPALLGNCVHSLIVLGCGHA